jgi:hypothetical protein
MTNRLLEIVIPPSELDAAIKAVADRIEEDEVLLLESLEKQDRTVWIKWFRRGAAVRGDSDGADEDGDKPESHLRLWQMMNLGTTLVIESLQSMTIGEEEEEEEDRRAFWTILASGDHGFRLFEMDFVREIVPEFREMYRRAFEIAQLVLLRKPTAKASKYLRRIPKAYVFGLEAETVMLCRASVEAALSDTFERHEVPEPKSMRARLAWAEMSGWLGAKRRKDAWTVWRRGSRVIHDDPDAVRDVLSIIARTVGVVTELVEESNTGEDEDD